MDDEPLLQQPLSASHSGVFSVSRIRSLVSKHRALLTAVTLLLLAAALLLWRPSSCDCRGRSPVPLSLLLSNDTRSWKKMEKLDESGAYLPFQTIVLLQPARTQLSPAYKQALDTLAADYGHLMSPLPLRSLHVTLSLILYRSWMPTLLRFNQLISVSHERLERTLFAFRQLPASPPLTMRVVNISTNGTGVTLNVLPATAADSERLSSRAALAAEMLGPLYVQQQRWHLTMAYWKPGQRVSASDQLSVQSALMSWFKDVEIVLERPHLCLSPNVAHCDLF